MSKKKYIDVGCFTIMVFLLQSCSSGGHSCEKIGKKTSADNPSREEIAWFAKNCLNQ